MIYTILVFCILIIVGEAIVFLKLLKDERKEKQRLLNAAITRVYQPFSEQDKIVKEDIQSQPGFSDEEEYLIEQEKKSIAKHEKAVPGRDGKGEA